MPAASRLARVVRLPAGARDRRRALSCRVLAALLCAATASSPSAGPPANDAIEDSVRDGVRDACERGAQTFLRWPDWSDVREPARSFYARREHRPAWTSGGAPTPQALALVALFEGAESRGLRAEDYDGLRWPRRIVRLQRSAVAEEAVEFELALTVSAMRLARDLHGGRLDPRRLGLPLDWPPKPLDLAALAAELATARDPAARLEALEPPIPVYRRLKRALVRYLELARERDLTPLPDADVVRSGDRWAGVPALRELLRRLGDLAPSSPPAAPEELYDDALAEAVRSFQRRHGLEVDGKIGRHTFAQLRTPLSARVDQIRFALERLRWVPLATERAPIVVNIPEFRLLAFDDDWRIAFSTGLVVGKAFRTQAPVFADRLRSVVFRPAWNVPVSIARDEIVPRLTRDPGYLAREEIEIVGASTQEITPETLARLRRGSLLLRQRPGAGNSLGLVKFDFPNQHNVYLHDTPARGLFARARRDFSHGCIRLEDAAGLAAWVLARDASWTPEAIRAAMLQGDDERSVPVVPPIPIYIVYITAVAPEGEEPRFFVDLYGHDARLAAALAEPYSQLRVGRAPG